MSSDKKLGYFDILIIILSVYLLLSILISTFLTLPIEIITLLNHIDTFICAIFFIEFIYNFINSSNKLEFMKWGWIDLISCIPMIDSLRYGRLIRLIRLLRLLRAFKSVTILTNHIFINKTKGMFLSVLIFSILLIIFSSIGILLVETDPNSNIKTAEDAIWWSYVTITTVGYGDKFPVTTEGRIIAVFLMTMGVGLFGTFTAYLSSFFVHKTE